MLPDNFDFSYRAQLSELMDEPCSRDELRACLRDVAKVNRWFRGHRPTFDWLDGLPLREVKGTVRILDVGCGYGDTLRLIERWAEKRRVDVELTGIDLNPDTVAIAAEASNGTSKIRWLAGDVLEYAPAEQPHLVFSELMAHHLQNAQIVNFIQWMEKNAVVSWLINDLSRAPVPYHFFRWFSRLMRLHPFVQHDGPVSIARAFAAEDWRKLCCSAGLCNGEVRVLGYPPARLCVSRSKA